MSAPSRKKSASLSLCGGMHSGFFSWDDWSPWFPESAELEAAQQKPGYNAKEVVLVPPFPQPETEVQRVQRGSLHPLICVQGCHLPSLVALISFSKQSQWVPNTR